MGYGNHPTRVYLNRTEPFKVQVSFASLVWSIVYPSIISYSLSSRPTLENVAPGVLQHCIAFYMDSYSVRSLFHIPPHLNLSTGTATSGLSSFLGASVLVLRPWASCSSSQAFNLSNGTLINLCVTSPPSSTSLSCRIRYRP